MVLIVRTSESLNVIAARLQSGYWKLTNQLKIDALIADGVIEIHPLKSGDTYNRYLVARITDIVFDSTSRRIEVHFENPNFIAVAAPIYCSSWVVKTI